MSHQPLSGLGWLKLLNVKLLDRGSIKGIRHVDDPKNYGEWVITWKK
jgi:hypothetical protein